MPPDPTPATDWLHSLIGIKAAHVVAGVLGGAVRGLISPAFPWSQRITSAVVGAAAAGYGTPVMTAIARQWMDSSGYPASDVEGVVGFLLGLSGMTVCDGVIKWIAKWWNEPPNNLGGYTPPSSKV